MKRHLSLANLVELTEYIDSLTEFQINKKLPYQIRLLATCSYEILRTLLTLKSSKCVHLHTNTWKIVSTLLRISA